MLVTSAISENPEGYPGPAPGRPGPLGPWFEKACPGAAGADTSPPGAIGAVRATYLAPGALRDALRLSVEAPSDSVTVRHH